MLLGGLEGGVGVVVVPLTYAESEHVGQLEPLLQAAGSELRSDWAEVMLEHEPASLSRKTMVPPTPSTVTQYVLPATTDADPTVIEFQAPATGEDVEPSPSNEPG